MTRAQKAIVVHTVRVEVLPTADKEKNRVPFSFRGGWCLKDVSLEYGRITSPTLMTTALAARASLKLFVRLHCTVPPTHPFRCPQAA